MLHGLGANADVFRGVEDMARDSWPGGFTWQSDVDSCYLVIEQSPALSATEHDRLRPGMNHLALNAAGRAEVDGIVAEAADHGWTLMFADRHPYAGGPQHYAAFLHNRDGYELEIVAPDPGPADNGTGR